MSALAPIRPRLAPLIRRLATTFDGERLATVGAIERTLKGAQLDFNDLAAAVEVEPEERVVIMWRDRPHPKRPVDGPPAWSDLSNKERIAWLDAIRTAAWVSEWERKFASDMWAHASYLASRPVSDRQKASLDRLLVRAFAQGTRPC